MISRLVDSIVVDAITLNWSPNRHAASGSHSYPETKGEEYDLTISSVLQNTSKS